MHTEEHFLKACLTVHQRSHYAPQKNTLCTGRQPPWWREAGISGTKQLYQPGPEPVIYIVPVTAILGRLALAPAGEHGTIPAFMRATPGAYPKGKCDEGGRPGTGSKLYYINLWGAMSWLSDHPLPNKEDYT